MGVPYTTLFMMTSVDGKISTGRVNERDFDKDLPQMVSGLDYYYAIEKTTDYWSMISGYTSAKLGANEGEYPASFNDCGHIVIDSRRLIDDGVRSICSKCREVILVTDGLYSYRRGCESIDNLRIARVPSLKNILHIWLYLYEMGVRAITVQTGGTINAAILRAGCIHRLDLFQVPVVVCGKTTSTLADGADNTTLEDLCKCATLKLLSAVPYDDCVRLRYEVQNAVPTTEKGY